MQRIGFLPSRRNLLRLAVVGAITLLCGMGGGDLSGAEPPVKLGIQTWTLRNLKFDEVVAFAVRHRIQYLQLIPNHINPSAPKEELLKKKEVMEKAGLVFYTYGVAGTSLDKEKNRPLFEFAKLMGLKLLVVEPGDLKIWDSLEELAKEYDVRVAVHNHGKGSTYGDPEVVKKVLKGRDARLGVCMDVGWVTGAGFDAAKVFEGYEGRVFDMHFKDKKIEKAADGKEVLLDVELGTGEANYAGLFEAMKRTKWEGVLAIESDNATFAKDPNDYVAKGIQFFRTHFQK